MIQDNPLWHFVQGYWLPAMLMFVTAMAVVILPTVFYLLLSDVMEVRRDIREMKKRAKERQKW